MKNNWLFACTIAITPFCQQLDASDLRDEKQEQAISTAQISCLEEDPLAPFYQERGYFTTSMINTKYWWSTNSNTEMDKFPNLTLGTIQEMLEENSAWKSIRGKSIQYTTGSREGSASSYEGYLVITDLTYGKSFFQFLSPQLGFSKTRTIECKRDEVSPFRFLEEIIANEGSASKFHKGTPAKDKYGNTEIEYVFYNSDSTREIRVKAIRKRKDEYESIIKDWKEQHSGSREFREDPETYTDKSGTDPATTTTIAGETTEGTTVLTPTRITTEKVNTEVGRTGTNKTSKKGNTSKIRNWKKKK